MAGSFQDFYRGKTVLVTGDSGFKGSWLATWLAHLGARVVGYSLDPPSEPSNFQASRLAQKITHVQGDVLDYERVAETVRTHRPDVVFHLAAQPLVRLSYAEPRRTFEVNLMGTVNLLDAARCTGSVQSFVAITSDKCYRNVNWAWSYRESDELGGYDAYSASKACAEIAIGVYQDERFQKAVSPSHEMPVASTRAGNVIGGGDWALDRVVPDTVRALSAGREIVIRSPEATRPWQHLLEPLSGYLWLGALLPQDRQYRTAWNLGPLDGHQLTVGEVVSRILAKWPAPKELLKIERDESRRESMRLRLDSGKAYQFLWWHAVWEIEQTLEAVVAWYRRFYDDPGSDMYSFTIAQIEQYTDSARQQDLPWACS